MNLDEKVQIDGIIEFHGIEKSITVKVDLIQMKDMIGLNGEFTINLSDFSVDRPSLLLKKIDDKIIIIFDLYFS